MFFRCYIALLSLIAVASVAALPVRRPSRPGLDPAHFYITLDWRAGTGGSRFQLQQRLETRLELQPRLATRLIEQQRLETRQLQVGGALWNLPF
ncbi:hypothetical protein B0H14DRAFT_2850835 [Mycena olivaceomarginata]|nr:hypothetical protein B0H14DRAFT_2850835 [Mycena olivaceomarginata]